MADENEQFECPECGKLVDAGVTSCPGCGMAFEWDEEETEEVLDELIEQVKKAGDEETEPPYDPSPEPVDEETVTQYDPSPGPVDEVTEPPYDPSPGPVDEVTEPPYDPSPEPEVVATAASYEEMEAPAEVPAEVPMEEGPMALEEPVAKKKALSMLGIAFTVLTIVSVIGLMVVLNYDTWIKGDAENHIGDTQIMFVYLGVAAVIVCLLVVVFDFMRSRKAA